MNQHGLLWTAEHNSALARLIGEGFSMAGSARELNGLFGTTYTRNAVIGKAHRLGLSKPKQLRKKKYAADAKPEPRHRPGRYKPNGPVLIPVTHVVMECSEVVPRNLTLNELERGDCRYPYGDRPFTFCGHAVREGSSFCPSHAAHCHTRSRSITEADHQQRRQNFIRLSRENSKQRATA